MYSSGIASAAIGVSTRQLDNFIHRYCRSTVPTGTQGRSRSMPHAAVELAAIALILARDLGCRPASAVALAARILANEGPDLALGSLCTLRFDLRRLRRVLNRALADAIEDSAPSRRGRPRDSSTAKKRRGASQEAPRRGW
jgi:hypothetical protein